MRSFLSRLTVSFAAVAFTASAAFAADPFTVAGVYVDATGESAIEAQTEAISNGQLRAANMLIERLTPEGQRQSAGWEGLDVQSAARLIRGMEIANEKRSSGRYLGDITVAFNPAAVQGYLQTQDLTMISSQSSERLVIPVLSGKLASGRHPWGAAWGNPALTHALTPIKAVPSGERLSLSAGNATSGNIDALKTEGARFGTRQILVAEAQDTGRGISVMLKDYNLNTGEARDMGRISAPDYAAAAVAAVARLEADWKQAAITQIDNAVSMEISVLYKSHADWQRMQNVINTSAQISDARLDALSKDGALMTITYGGDISRLANELSYKGVAFEQTEALGAVIKVAGR